MQTTFAPPPPQNGYQPPSEAEIYAIKRQYLALLPPQQIIDICLTFEANAPLHVKSTVWPYDIRAAIASILAQKAQASQAQTSSDSDPLKATTSDLDGPYREKTAQPQTDTLQRSTASTALLPANTLSVSQPATSQNPPTTPGPHYPHQPYYHPAYPHASHYTSPHATFGYPHSYPSYPQMYPVNPAGHPPPLFTNAPLVHPPHSTSEPPPPLNNVDDLPSYEEMIVEALLDSGDPEGCAPKNLFGWMAAHYPLQMNFRPSASQALQKAYKRGRLEKGSNGRYRLNENWEGGNTSRRTTRRPQILAQTMLTGPQPSSSPFTHTPLVPHGAPSLQARLPPPGQPPGYAGYPFGFPYQGMPNSTHSSVSWDSSGTSQKPSTNAADYEAGEGSDAWEAAQNILKAINFGQLFQISNEENKAGESSMSTNSIGRQGSTDGSDRPSLRLDARMTEELTARVPKSARKSAELDAEQRAALQAQLVLLAAQLAELADVSEDELSHNLEVFKKPPALYAPHGEEPEGGEDSDEMVEVPALATSVTV